MYTSKVVAAEMKEGSIADSVPYPRDGDKNIGKSILGEEWQPWRNKKNGIVNILSQLSMGVDMDIKVFQALTAPNQAAAAVVPALKGDVSDSSASYPGFISKELNKIRENRDKITTRLNYQIKLQEQKVVQIQSRLDDLKKKVAEIAKAEQTQIRGGGGEEEKGV